MKNALITAIGSFSADVVIKNLKKMNIRVIGCDIYPKNWIADAYNVDTFYQAPYATDEENYISFIKKICINENITFLLPLTDIEIDILNKNREWFIKNNICLCMSEKNTINTCRNKKTIYEFIENQNLNINLIPTSKILDNKPISDFPIVCKLDNGRSSQGLQHIKNISEWKVFLQQPNLEHYIMQPYINGNIITVDIIRSEFEKKTIVIPRQELLRTLNGAGTTVYVYHDEKLESICKELANVLNINGCVNFEWIKDKDGKYYFLECNPRFSGGVEFSCLAGYDCIKNHLRCFMNEAIDDFTLKKSYYIARKYEEYITEIK